jgi:hypothetical protein
MVDGGAVKTRVRDIYWETHIFGAFLCESMYEDIVNSLLGVFTNIYGS